MGLLASNPDYDRIIHNGTVLRIKGHRTIEADFGTIVYEGLTWADKQTTEGIVS